MLKNVIDRLQISIKKHNACLYLPLISAILVMFEAKNCLFDSYMLLEKLICSTNAFEWALVELSRTTLIFWPNGIGPPTFGGRGYQNTKERDEIWHACSARGVGILFRFAGRLIRTLGLSAHFAVIHVFPLLPIHTYSLQTNAINQWHQALVWA